MRTATKNRIGTVSALIATLRGVGLAIGMALIGSIYSVRRAFHLARFNDRMVDGDHETGPDLTPYEKGTRCKI